MSRAVFVEADVPVYASGGDHPLKEPCARILRSAAESPRPFVTDSEVLRQLLHRYLAQGRREPGREMIRAFAEAMHGRIEPVQAEDVLTAAGPADSHPDISARDLVHAAVMQRVGTRRIISADVDFDSIGGVERLDPARSG